MKPLQVDPARATLPETGIYCRAFFDGKPDSVDIVYLTRESLMEWLRSRGGDNPWAENTVALLLGHQVD